jgi:hypothetical protein
MRKRMVGTDKDAKLRSWTAEFRLPVMVNVAAAALLLALWLAARSEAAADRRAYDNAGRSRVLVRDSEAETRARGERVAEALERYRATHGRYPVRLRQLAPDFIAALPMPLCGPDTWFYQQVDNGRSYRLRFGAIGDRYETYTIPGWDWDHGTASWSPVN